MKTIRLIAMLILTISTSWANNVVTSGISIGGQNTTSHFTKIKYSITWDNSWRTANNESNYDGCWIFAKFRKKNASAWQHATINYVSPGTATACGHTEPAGSTIQTAADGKGVWMYRNAVGSGTVNWANAELRWNYGVDGVADNDSVEIKLFALEMVYVPQGAYLLGSNGTESSHFRRGDKDTVYAVTSEAAITVGTTATNLYSSTPATLANGTIAAAYPKGYNAFWCMKYEISQRQYADFLNNLDFAGATTRATVIFTGTHPALTAPEPERAIAGLSFEDMLSLLDWSALRPMSEFEYEKACRGSNMVPIPNEYAWGNTTISQLGTPSNLGAINETWAIGNANYYYSTPMRCGALATATSNRTQSGGTYYGIMEMTGNSSEVTVNANTNGRVFTGAHGDGNLNTSAAYNTANWPTLANTYGRRGGSFETVSWILSELAISDRNLQMDGNAVTTRQGSIGGRGVRTAE